LLCVSSLPHDGQGKPSLRIYGSSEGCMSNPQAGQFFEYADDVVFISLSNLAVGTPFCTFIMLTWPHG
jgi:hypothetical protein